MKPPEVCNQCHVFHY